MKRAKKKLQHIIQLGVEVSQIGDLDILLEKILNESRDLVGADAGSIYIKEEKELKFSYAQNETLRKKVDEGKNSFILPSVCRSLKTQSPDLLLSKDRY